jgi:hypothetical protein
LQGKIRNPKRRRPKVGAHLLQPAKEVLWVEWWRSASI